jgi:sortase A
MVSLELVRKLRVGPFVRRRRPAGRAATRAAELSPAVAVARWMVAGLSLLAIWALGFALLFSRLQEHRGQHALYGDFREKLALQTARIGPDATGDPIPVGEPVALLTAPAAHLADLVVVEGTSSGALQSGPGHRRDTVLPGQAGVSLVYGRSVTFGGPFASIAGLRAGDEIRAVTGQGKFVYRVAGVRRPGDPLPPLPAAGASRLTLVTAESSGWRSGWSPTGTVYVDAVLTSPKTAPASPGHLARVPESEKSMRPDTSGLMALVLWLQGLLLTAIGMVWAWRHWGAWPTWVVGSVVLLALLWGATGSATLLLPNLV